VSLVQTRDSIQKALKQILRSRQAEAGEDYVTLRNERFVIPVRSEHRRNVPGVVHGASATGQTIFVEPFETVETNNQLVQLAEDEAAEIFRILKELTERLQAERGPWMEFLRGRDLRGISMHAFPNLWRQRNCGWRERGIRCWKTSCDGSNERLCRCRWSWVEKRDCW
jgi:hypothetical protein